MLPVGVGKCGQHCPHKIAFFFRREGERKGGREGGREGEGGEREGRKGRKKGKSEEVKAISGGEMSGCSVYL